MRRGFLLIFLLFALTTKAVDTGENITVLHEKARQLFNSNLDSALLLTKAAEELAVKDNLQLEEGISLFFQAYIYSVMDQSGKAFVLYLHAMNLLKPLKSQEASMNYLKILLNAGEILKQHYAYHEAILYYNEGIKVAQENGFDAFLIQFLYNKSSSLRHLNNLDEALITVDQAIKLSQALEDEKWMLSSLNQQGLILKDMKRYEEARVTYEKMISHKYDKADSNKFRGQAWHNIAVSYIEELRYAEATKAFSKALEAKEGGDDEKLFITLKDLGEAYYLMGQYESAYKISQKAVPLYDMVLLVTDHYELFNTMSKIAYKTGDFDKAHLFSQQFEQENRKFLDAQERILKIRNQHKMDVLTAKYFQELKATETEKNYQMVLIICVMFFTSIIIFEKVRQYYIRHSLKQALLQIEQE